MKSLFTTLFALITFVLTAQQLKFEGELVDTIHIRSHLSIYQFDDAGTTNGKAEHIYFAYDEVKKEYVISEHYLDTYEQTFRPDTFTMGTKPIKSSVGKSVDGDNISMLLNALSQSKDHHELFQQVDTVELRKHLKHKHIVQVIKQHEEWEFFKGYSSKKENEKLFSGCRSLDTFQVYLQEQYNDKGYVFITDYSNTIDIWVTTDQSRNYFEGKYPNKLKQPWYRYQGKSSLIKEGIFNFDINKALIHLLPKGFMHSSSISTEELSNDYLIWYLKRHDILD